MKSIHTVTARVVTVLMVTQASLASNMAIATPGGLTLSDEVAASTRGNEFTSGATPGAVLIKVNLWGAVSKSGIHHVPARTDLLTLLSYAGGPLTDANLDEIRIRRMINNKVESIEVDLDQVLGFKSKPLVLEPNDVIVVTRSQPTFSTNTVNTIATVAGILSIFLAGIVIHDRVRN